MLVPQILTQAEDRYDKRFESKNRLQFMFSIQLLIEDQR